jgi:hypothetical protein
MPYQTMLMNFGLDGLESEYPVFSSNDSDECYRHAIKLMGTSLELYRVIEVDEDGRYVWNTQGTPDRPYPHVSEPDCPDFFRDF